MPQDVFSQVQINVLLQQVLGQDFRVVDGQELDKRSGCESKVELHRQLVNLADDIVSVERRAIGFVLQLHHLNRDGVSPPQPRPTTPVTGVPVTLHGVHHVVGVQGFAVGPLDPVAKMEGKGRALLIGLPTFRQVSHHHSGFSGVELHDLVVQLGVRDHAGQRGRTQRVPILGICVSRHASHPAMLWRPAWDRRRGGPSDRCGRGCTSRANRSQRRQRRCRWRGGGGRHGLLLSSCLLLTTSRLLPGGRLLRGRLALLGWRFRLLRSSATYHEHEQGGACETADEHSERV